MTDETPRYPEDAPRPTPAGASDTTRTPDAPEAPSNDGEPPGASELPRTTKRKDPRRTGRPKGAKDQGIPPDLTPEDVGVPVAGPEDAPGASGVAGSSLSKRQRAVLRRAVADGRKRDREKAKAAKKRGGRKQLKNEPRKTGRPRWEPSEEQKAQLMALAGLGMTMDETSMVLGLSLETLRSREADVMQWRMAGLAIAKSRVRQAGYQQAVAGSLGHWRFFEERVLGYNPRVEHTGAGGGPIETRDLTKPMSDDDLLARLRTLADKRASVRATARTAPTPTATTTGAERADADSADADSADAERDDA